MQEHRISTRKTLQADVRTARRLDRISIAAPGDFVLGPARPADASLSNLLPYCLDLPRRRSVYVGGVDAHAAQEAPFYYLHLRRHAAFVVSVPWGRAAPASKASPVFLFSPGRCGSTLLSRLLQEGGVANVSEPDFYTQAAWSVCAGAWSPLRGPVRQAVAEMGGVLCTAMGSPLVVKLRAEVCRAPAMLLSDREPRTIFMTRDFESWARSTARAFRNAPAKAVRKYLAALACHAALRRRGDCHLLRYEDLVADPAAAAAALGAFLRAPIAPEGVARAMKEDSQEGTPLARGLRAGTPGLETQLAATLALWNSDRVKRRREAFGVF